MSNPELISNIIISALGGAAGGGIIGFVAKRWIENKFSKNLEDFKIQKSHELDLMLTRKLKWHDKEQEVLSEAWIKLTKAHRALKRAIMILRECPDLNKMSDDEFKEFVSKMNCSDEDKKLLLNQ